jgi:RNase P subunit RPR2
LNELERLDTVTVKHKYRGKLPKQLNCTCGDRSKFEIYAYDEFNPMIWLMCTKCGKNERFYIFKGEGGIRF